MNRLLILIVLLCVLACGSAMSSLTLTFDDVSAGTQVRYSSLYRDTYRVSFGDTFRATDYAVGSWPVPPSGQNVLTITGSLSRAWVLFGSFTYSTADYDDLASVGAYFSTQPDARVRITAYYYYEAGGKPADEVTSVEIGGEGQSWQNHYVEIASPGHMLNTLKFEGVNSPSDLLGFCADDMTITYVPEPSSLLVLSGGFGILGLLTRRQRRASVST